MKNSRTFRYSLQALETLNRWERDSLAGQINEVAALVHEHQRAIADIGDRMEEALAMWRQAVASAAGIDLAQREIINRFLASQAQKRSTLAEQLADLEQREHALRAQYLEAERMNEGLERHQQGERAAFDQTAAKRNYVVVDELALRRASMNGYRAPDREDR